MSIFVDATCIHIYIFVTCLFYILRLFITERNTAVDYVKEKQKVKHLKDLLKEKIQTIKGLQEQVEQYHQLFADLRKGSLHFFISCMVETVDLHRSTSKPPHKKNPKIEVRGFCLLYLPTLWSTSTNQMFGRLKY